MIKPVIEFFLFNFYKEHRLLKQLLIINFKNIRKKTDFLYKTMSNVVKKNIS